jgi:phosphatidate cytidylyltransferase
MRLRLFLGPIMIALLLAGLWADEALTSVAMPGWAVDAARAVLPADWSDSVPLTWPPGTVVFAVVLLLAVLASREVAALLSDKGILASKRISTFAAVLGLLVSCIIPAGISAVDAVAAVSASAMIVLMSSLLFFSRHRTVEGVVAATGGALLSYVYLGLMFGFLLAIRREHTAWALLWVLIVTKACDIGAYFTGKAIGKHKLIPWLSPGKTWEGLIGGVLFSAIVGFVAWPLVIGHVQGSTQIQLPGAWIGALAAIFFALIGQAGDLMESMLKRDAGVKDSGKAVPGFGGILDVIDSPLLVGPFAYWWLRWIDQQL